MKIKFFWVGLFLAFLPTAALALRSHVDEPSPLPVQLTNTVETMPVEVVAKGGKAEWVMVEVSAEAIPEPSTTALLMFLSTLVILRRKR